MDKHLKIASYIATLLDARFKIFNIRFGYDTLLGLAPGIGDAVSLVFSMYLLWIAIQVRVPVITFMKMVRNIVLDFAIGVIPVVGDLSDVFFRANMRNLELLKLHAKTDIAEGEIVTG